MTLRSDMHGYWDSYRETQEKFFEELALRIQPMQVTDRIAPHFACVYCKERFQTAEAMQSHYNGTQAGGDPLLIPRSRRGYTEERWQKGNAAISAPTIKSIG